ncbi:AAA family ATPase [Bradyrhizobium sp. SEMIA]|uniref:AAA family ATPase n=1 Tax=Bradyrhizobium sp. SEMIA TaxID=2597515 RepID=UPI0018A39E20|nr:AAA family ATPase [Bradyrhizobium sp. SEMIA]QOG17908.1 AAA family ATPase [Bradyrhizobium sp. SEMIA]
MNPDDLRAFDSHGNDLGEIQLPPSKPALEARYEALLAEQKPKQLGRNDRLNLLRGSKGPLSITPLEDVISEEVEKAHFIKGIIAWNETSAWIAPPGGMKSALLASASINLALGRDWFGKKNKCAVGVVYFALERADLVKRRLSAHLKLLGVPRSQPVPVVVVSGMIDGMNPETVPLIVGVVRRIEKYFDSFESGVHMAGLLVFDTFAKLVAAGGGDENSAKDQGRVFANIQRIKDQLEGPHVALIGHTGKDESRGARGSNAIYGDVDMMVEIGGDTIKTATVTKANDAPEGPLFSFTSEIFNFGEDEDGDPITVNIVSEEVSAPSAPRSAEPRLSTNQRVMFRLLADAGPAGLSVEAWNDLARELGISSKQRLYELRMALKDKGLVREYAGAWKAHRSCESSVEVRP